jgi:hypothetical protein
VRVVELGGFKGAKSRSHRQKTDFDSNSVSVRQRARNTMRNKAMVDFAS